MATYNVTNIITTTDGYLTRSATVNQTSTYTTDHHK